MTNWRFIFALGFAHAVGDAISGFAVASLVAAESFLNVGMIVVAYNLVAFGLQPIAGAIADRAKGTWQAALIGTCAMGSGLLLFLLSPLAGVALIAIGSAFFHVGAGALATQAVPGKTIGAAVFTAPGVIGLTFGIIAALESRQVLPGLLVAVVAAALLLAYAHKGASLPAKQTSSVGSYVIPRAVLVAVALLLLGVSVRSGMWLAFSASSFGFGAIYVFAVAAGLGKLLGGLATDAFGAKLLVPASMLAALVCLLSPSLLFAVLGIVFLQSSTPVILTLVIRAMPQVPATAAGLVLGLAMAIGGIMVGIVSVDTMRLNGVTVAMASVAAVAFSLGLEKLRRSTGMKKPV